MNIQHFARDTQTLTLANKVLHAFACEMDQYLLHSRHLLLKYVFKRKALVKCLVSMRPIYTTRYGRFQALGWDRCVRRIAVPFIFMLFYDPIKSHNMKIKTTFMRTNFICCRRHWCVLRARAPVAAAVGGVLLQAHKILWLKCMRSSSATHTSHWHACILTGRMLNAYALLLLFFLFVCSSIHLLYRRWMLTHRTAHLVDIMASSLRRRYHLRQSCVCVCVSDVCVHLPYIQFHQWRRLIKFIPTHYYDHNA